MDKPKIITFDLETSPLVAYSWGPKWDTKLIEIIDQSMILSYSAKWLGGKHITKGWIDYEGYKKGNKNDKEIVKDIWKLFDEADIIVVQNGKAFDTKSVNSRFIYYHLPPPSPYKIVDTLLENRKLLRMPSYSLDDICAYYDIGRKQEHEGFGLWKKCMAGDEQAWKRMLRYNKHDVTLTEQLYLLVRPYMKAHPNLGNYQNKVVCPKCSSMDVQFRGYYFGATTQYRKFVCKNCGAWSRTTHNVQKIKPLAII